MTRNSTGWRRSFDIKTKAGRSNVSDVIRLERLHFKLFPIRYYHIKLLVSYQFKWMLIDTLYGAVDGPPSASGDSEVT